MTNDICYTEPERSETMTKQPAKNRAAVALGKLGGARNTAKQNRARRENAQRGGGRPGRVCIECGEPVRGGHVDARLDKTCGEHGWRWQQRASAPPPAVSSAARSSVPNADTAQLLTEAIALLDAAPGTAIPVVTISEWIARARAALSNGGAR